MKKLKNLINELKIVNSKQISNPYSLEALFKIIAIYLTPLFYYLKINANQLTWMHFITSASGAIVIIALGYDYYAYGVTLYFLGVMMDFCDGSIARISNNATFYGRFLDGLLEVPEKITSSIPEPLILFAEFSPMHHLKDSTMLDFPHPLGPTIPVKPSSIKKVVLSENDLNPVISSFLNFIYKFFSIIFLNFS